MSTPIQPVPDVVLAPEFPTLADRPAGTYNAKAAAWANGENAMAVRTREIAATAANNATAAEEQAQIATTKAEFIVAAAIATAEDRVQTGLDAEATAADRAAVEQVLVDGPVISVGGETGVVKVKTINGEAITGEGNIVLPPPEAVLAPVNVTPANEAVEVTSVTFTGSPYYSLYGKAQKARQARMSLSPTFDAVAWDSGAIAGAGLAVNGPSFDGLIPNSTTVYWQMRYQDANDAWSAWSQASSFTTGAQYIPTVIGEPFGGGYYAGKIKVGADTYAIITAPKSAEAALTWKTASTSTPGTASTADGFANSAAMNDAAHLAAKHCRDYRGGGHADWYLPAQSELEIEYRAFKPDATANNTSHGANADSSPTTGNYTSGAPPQTVLVAFKTGGAEAFATGDYWSSTESAAAEAWSQRFSNGFQSSGTVKSSTFIARPVRRLKI